MVPQAELISKGYLSLIPGLISIFLEMVWFSLTNYSMNYILLYVDRNLKVPDLEIEQLQLDSGPRT